MMFDLPKATTAITARSGGPANHCPQQSFPERSDGDLEQTMKIENYHKITNYYVG